LSCYFGNSVGACKTLITCHYHVDVVRCTEVDNAFVFGCNNYLCCGHSLEALLKTTLHDSLATEIGERLARKSGRCKPRRNYDEEIVRGV
jgi:hypothetical protein